MNKQTLYIIPKPELVSNELGCWTAYTMTGHGGNQQLNKSSCSSEILEDTILFKDIKLKMKENGIEPGTKFVYSNLIFEAKGGFREAGQQREWVFKDGKYIDEIYMDILARAFEG